jgi:membrane-associated phospholipid phosphatase
MLSLNKTSKVTMRIIALLIVSVAFGVTSAFAATASTAPKMTYGNPTITSLGTATAIAIPLLAGSVALYKHDWKGVGQLAAEGILTVGTAYALKNIVRERRPDGSDFQSFPSGTTAVAASGSSFLWGRYGWEFGVPALFATQFVSYSRIQAKEHHWYDTLASSAIAAGYGLIVTTPFKKKYNIDTQLAPMPGGAEVQLSYTFN